jgi:hypothetical protein
MPISNGLSLLLRGLGSLMRNIAVFLVRLADKSDQVGSTIRSSGAAPPSGPVSIDQIEAPEQETGSPPHWVEDIRERRREVRSNPNEFQEQIGTPNGDVKRRSLGRPKAGQTWIQPLTRWTSWMRRGSSNAGRGQPDGPPSHWVEHIRERRQAVRYASNELEELRRHPLHGLDRRRSNLEGVDQPRTQRSARWVDWLWRGPSEPGDVLPDDAPPHWVQYVRQRRRELGRNTQAPVDPDSRLYQSEEAKFPTAGRNRPMEVGRRSPGWWRRLPPLDWIGHRTGFRPRDFSKSGQDGAHSLGDSTARRSVELDDRPGERRITETLPTSFSEARHKTGLAASTGKSYAGSEDRKTLRIRPISTEGQPVSSKPASGKFRVASDFNVGEDAQLPGVWEELSSTIPHKQGSLGPGLSYWPDFPDRTEQQLQDDSAPVRASSFGPLRNSASSNRGDPQSKQGDSGPDAFTDVHDWPAFLDGETNPPGSGQWEVKYRELRRSQRLEREQRGLPWNESLF